MAACTFLFDIIVVRIQTPNMPIEDQNQLSVNVTFNNQPISITASRINVVEFRSGRNLEFNDKPDKLRATLAKCGLPMVVMYRGRPLGQGTMPWPDNILEQIVEDMAELTYVGRCDFFRAGQPVGTVELLCRLVLKCAEKEEEGGDGPYKERLDQSINPRDILFVVSQSQKCPIPNPCDACLDVWEPEAGDQELDLDLSRYKDPNTRAVLPPESFSEAKNTACCELKKMAREYEEIIDAITNRIPIPPGLKRRLPQQRDESQGGVGGSPTNLVDLASPCLCYAEKHDSPGMFAGGMLPNQAHKEPLTDIPNLPIKPIRFCPHCLKNMSWMPKYAACPNCGAKPMPVIEDKFAPKKITADQILKEYLGKSNEAPADYCQDPCRDEALQRAQPGADDPAQTECRCTCKFGKICAHCRIRTLCQDIFKVPEKDEPECPMVEAKTSEDFCVVNTSSKDCRPYLARVFSELRDLYDIKETNKKPSEFDEKCEEPADKSKKQEDGPKETHSENEKSGKRKTKEDLKRKSTNENKRKSAIDDKESNKDETKKSISKHDSTRVSEGKKKRVSAFPITKARHKFCVQGGSRAVPRRMGWLWTANSEAQKHGWRPGAIRKPIKNIMRFFLNYEDDVNTKKKSKQLEEAKLKADTQKAILNVSKKNGEIFITLCAPNDDEARPTKPIVFKIVKSSLAIALRDIKRILKDQGFAKCTCHRPLHLCICRDPKEKLKLTSALGVECSKRGMRNVVDKLVLTDTSESDLEFNVDVSPPVCGAKHKRGKKPRMISHGTQWKKNDWVTKPKYPIKIDPYWRRYDCAVGDRYMGNAWGAPGEEVYEDGAFGFFGGGAHGPAGKVAAIRQAMSGKGRQRGRGNAAGASGPGGIGGGPGGGGLPAAFAGMPGAAKVAGPSGTGGGGPIPVRMPERWKKEQAAKEAAAKAAENDTGPKGVDMLQYLKGKGALGGQKGKSQTIGPDGLTDAQRKRKLLSNVTQPAIEMVAHRAHAVDCCPYAGYDPCCTKCSCCDPCWTYYC